MNSIKSHPNKLLSEHLEGVKDKAMQLTSEKTAALLALWHDVGKANVNFQKLIDGFDTDGYSHHSYLSAFSLFCALINDRRFFEKYLGEPLASNDVVALVLMIAKHHGDLPDFCPERNQRLLDTGEIDKLYAFLSSTNLPIEELLGTWFIVKGFNKLLLGNKAQNVFKERLIFQPQRNEKPLDFFLGIQHSFACLLLSDKADAACRDEFLEDQRKDVNAFSSIFPSVLHQYLSSLRQDTALNKLRTTIRQNAIENIKIGLKETKRIFELTAPTGSGKTLMLLSLAAEVIKQTGSKRIIYALPFLSITEQVEQEVTKKIFKDYRQYIQRIDSKSENPRLDKLLQKADDGLSEEEYNELDMMFFSEQTFSYPFVITTFVRLFESILSNKNSELLKLPNFSNCIFLLDEIQTLPPRLYGFFIAFLTRFCEKNNSYAIVSTATQPNFELPNNDGFSSECVHDFFTDYQCPFKLLDFSYFQDPLFNRYTINYRKNDISIESLAKEINESTDSALVILNTIDDTKNLFNKINHKNKILLNTHFTPAHRKWKIEVAKRLLEENIQVVVISTQLVEAGVDIDFPIVYRDMTTVASIVQSAGRCNRNGKLGCRGTVYLVNIVEEGRIRANYIYRGKDTELLRFTRGSLKKEKYEEVEMMNVQKFFFDSIQQQLNFGTYYINKEERSFLKDIRECMFGKIGQFSLIDKNEFGEEVMYYVPDGDDDDSFNKLLKMNDELISMCQKKCDVKQLRDKKRMIENQLKKMQNNIVQIRLRPSDSKPTPGNTRSYFNLHEIAKEEYSKDGLGVNLLGSSFF